MLIKTFCLFEGRHDLPQNEGALCSGFNFITKKAVRTALWDEIMELAPKAQEPVTIKVIVTGLTPALTEFIGSFAAKYTNSIFDWCPPQPQMWPEIHLVLLHWDKESNSYWEQNIM